MYTDVSAEVPWVGGRRERDLVCLSVCRGID